MRWYQAVSLSVHMYNHGLHWRVSVEFGIGDFYEKLSRYLKFD
jgi:hypothetical protein